MLGKGIVQLREAKAECCVVKQRRCGVAQGAAKAKFSLVQQGKGEVR